MRGRSAWGKVWERRPSCRFWDGPPQATQRAQQASDMLCCTEGPVSQAADSMGLRLGCERVALQPGL